MKLTPMPLLTLLGLTASPTLAGAASPLRGPPGNDPPQAVQWFRSAHMSALGKARQEHRLLAFYFWMEGSAQCTRMFGETWQAAVVARESADFVCMGIDIAGARGATRHSRTALRTKWTSSSSTRCSRRCSWPRCASRPGSGPPTSSSAAARTRTPAAPCAAPGRSTHPST